ncbi:MAG: hypothetical protein DHS20C07_24750 [Methyloligella sp.]|nr:MAG: hypothetical protein DHS20C07_24750 [Methyloligella sp.]
MPIDIMPLKALLNLPLAPIFRENRATNILSIQMNIAIKWACLINSYIVVKSKGELLKLKKGG